jgi:hypothetical protein
MTSLPARFPTQTRKQVKTSASVEFYGPGKRGEISCVCTLVCRACLASTAPDRLLFAAADRAKWLGPFSEGSVPSYLKGRPGWGTQ